MPDCDLQGAGILVTRPAHQAAGLCTLIESRNGLALRFPALEIQPAADQLTAATLLRQASGIVIFVSPNAVKHGLRLMQGNALSAQLTLGAVGKATAKALQEAGYKVDLMPSERFDSEGLLALPDLQQISGKEIVIVRGVGGRPLLGDSLQERGAEVVYAEVYRRVCPDAAPSSLLRRWEEDVHLVIATSIEILMNLRRMLGSNGWSRLQRTPLLVISERMLQKAEVLGFETILRAKDASDLAVVDCVCDWMTGNAKR